MSTSDKLTSYHMLDVHGDSVVRAMNRISPTDGHSFDCGHFAHDFRLSPSENRSSYLPVEIVLFCNTPGKRGVPENSRPKNARLHLRRQMPNQW